MNHYYIGSWICTGNSAIAELMSKCGYDFLTIDVEHAPVDMETAFRLLQAIRSGNPFCKAYVRLPGNVYADTKRYLDAGADGVICPMVNTAEDAKSLVNAVKYPPLGQRGVGFCRANDYGLNLQESVANSNDRTFVCVQIEHIDAIRNLESILSVPGVDAAMIGPYDLSASMGITGQFDHPEMVRAIDRMLELCQKHNVLPGIHQVQPDPEMVIFRIKQGYRFIAYSVDITFVSQASKQLFAAL
jgi:2-keto-3-deoxy-L-rhamnonate aldolase RhmA